MLTVWLWLRSRPTSGIFWRQGGRSPRSARMGWIFFAGSGSCRRALEWPGIGRPAPRPAISADGCRSPASSLGRIGAPVARPVRWGAFRRVRHTRRRCGRTPKRCCGPSITSIWMRAAGRSSTRSRWIGPGGAGGRTRTTTRWSPTVTSAAGFTGRGCRTGFPAVSRTASSTRSSRGCRRTGTGRWSPSTCRPGRGRLNCCRRPWLASTRGGS